MIQLVVNGPSSIINISFHYKYTHINKDSYAVLSQEKKTGLLRYKNAPNGVLKQAEVISNFDCILGCSEQDLTWLLLVETAPVTDLISRYFVPVSTQSWNMCLLKMDCLIACHISYIHNHINLFDPGDPYLHRELPGRRQRQYINLVWFIVHWTYKRILWTKIHGATIKKCNGQCCVKSVGHFVRFSPDKLNVWPTGSALQTALFDW